MGRLWLSAIECYYEDIDRQLKEQYIHGLELTKVCENEEITSENELSWAKRVGVQRAQSIIINSLTGAREFDKLKVVKTYTRKAQEDTCR